MALKKPDDDIIIKIPRKFFTPEVKNMLNLIRHKKIVSKSKATAADIEKIEKLLKAERGKAVTSLLTSKGLLTK
jgi:hypothetical protein